MTGTDTCGLRSPRAAARWLVLGILVLLTSCRPAPDTIKIVSAKYGAAPLNKLVDCKAYVGSKCAGKSSCSFQVTSTMCGDPVPGESKELNVAYSCGRTEKTGDAPQYGYLELSCT